jgi:TatD DNase family protein
MSELAEQPLVDTHSHVQDPEFDRDRDEALDRARAAGLQAIVSVGYDLTSSRRAVQLAEAQPDVFAAVGIHPNSVAQAGSADWSEICDLARHPKVVALGETGLDNYRKYTPPNLQEASLWRHLELAEALSLPVVIHNREASPRMRQILGEWTGRRRNEGFPGVMHCFSADAETLTACLKYGFVISIAGPVTYKNAESLRARAKDVPVGRLVVETDCPYLTPEPHRGKRNEPAFVAHTARRLAEVRSESFAELAVHTTQTASELFGLPLTAAPAASRS